MKTQTEANSVLKERLIELSFYITQSITKGENEKVIAYREEMNSVIDTILNQPPKNGTTH